MKKNMLGINRAYFSWCEKRDLNPYGKNHTPLKRARLPVPPLSHLYLGLLPSTGNIISYSAGFVKGYFKFSQFSILFALGVRF